LAKLKIAAAASPPLRKFFAREPPSNAYSTKIVVVLKPDAKKNKVEQKLLWLLSTLWEDSHTLLFASMPVVMEELEHLIQSETQAQELLSLYLVAVVGDLSIIS